MPLSTSRWPEPVLDAPVGGARADLVVVAGRQNVVHVREVDDQVQVELLDLPQHRLDVGHVDARADALAEVHVLELGMILLEDFADPVAVAGADAAGHRIADVADARPGVVEQELIVGKAEPVVDDGAERIDGCPTTVLDRGVVARLITDQEAQHALEQRRHHHDRGDRDEGGHQNRAPLKGRFSRFVHCPPRGNLASTRSGRCLPSPPLSTQSR